MTKRLMRQLNRLWDLPEWMQEGACAYEGDPDWWFPDKNGLTATLETRLAVNICSTCPVRAQCLAYANEHHEQGTWGGLTEQQRATLYRRGNRRQSSATTERLKVCSLLSSY